MSKHTKGEWGVFKAKIAIHNIIAVEMTNDEGLKFLNTVNDVAVSTEEALANATLMAASPDLYREANRYFPILAKLQDKHPKIWEELTTGYGIATVNGLQNAIKKATT